MLEIESGVYGTREPYSTAITEVSLGQLLLQPGEAQRGMELLAHAYGVFQRQLGPEHHYTRDLAALFAQLASEPAEEAS